jgi:hypothetical protein
MYEFIFFAISNLLYLYIVDRIERSQWKTFRIMCKLDNKDSIHNN